MALLDTIMNTQNGAAVGKLARDFGLSDEQAQQALKQLVPGLSSGVKKNLQQPDGLEKLLEALNKKDHGRFLDEPDRLGDNGVVEDGNGILGHILGSKDTSRELAGRASQGTGLSSGLLKKLLPFAAQLVMGALSKQASGSGMLGGAAARQQNQHQNPLLAMLDSDGDGSVIDDLLGLAGRFMSR